MPAPRTNAQGGVLYISINSQFYHIQCANAEADVMKAEQEVWLEAELTAAATSGAKHVVLLSQYAASGGLELGMVSARFCRRRCSRSRVVHISR